MSEMKSCPKCKSQSTYLDAPMWVCLECGNEWEPLEIALSGDELGVVVDSNGNVLKNGDTVTVIKDLKVKGLASGLKAGTKAKNIVLCEPHDGHNISCKVDGVGAIYLKSEFVKKV